MTAEDIKNYAQFEDECVKKNFTFESLLEAREKQIAKKPIDRCVFKECPNCGEIEIQYCNHCPRCGQKLDWSENNE